MNIHIDERSLPRLQRWGMMALALLLTLLPGVYFTVASHFSQQAESRRLETELLRQQEALLQAQVQEVGNYLQHVRSRTESVLQQQIQDQVGQALQLLEQLYQLNRKRMPEAELRRLLAESLRPIRFLEGRGYYFIDDLQGNCILLPINPEREGSSLLDNQDDQGTLIMRELLQAVDNPDKAGFARYRWYVNGRSGMQDKIAYAQVFAPYGWLVGTGEYVFKVEETLQREALARIRALSFGEDGYVAILARDGTPLLSPSRPASEHQPPSALPPSEQAAIQAILAQAQKGGGMVRYDWVTPGTGKLSRKMSYVQVIPEWNWVLVGGIHLDQISQTLEEQARRQARELQQSLLGSLLILALAALLALAFSALYSRWFKGLFQRYQETLAERNQALEASNQQLHFNKFLMDHASDICLLLDEEERIVYANRTAELFFQRQQLPGTRMAELGLPELGGLPRQQSVEIDYQDPAGREYALEISLAPADYQGHSYSCAILRDVSLRKEQEAHSRLAAHVFESGQEAMLVCDKDNRVMAANHSFTRITGYTQEEMLGRDPMFLKSGRHGPEFYEAIWYALEHELAWSGEIWNRRKDGSFYPAWFNINRITDPQGRTTHYIAAFSDISAQKDSEARVRHLAEHDPLTNLPNRSLLGERLQQAMPLARRDGGMLAVLCLDLDRFKIINDSLGHGVGDQFLIETALRLHQCIRARDTVSRLGGDEFAVLLTDLDSADQAALMARRILGHIGAPAQLGNQLLSVTPSIGIALFPGDGDDVETLLKNAEAAMYHAKQQGRNNCQFFTPSINERFNERLLLEKGLRQALAQSQLSLHYQPQFDLESGALTGSEALLRWTSPELGAVPPTRFIPVAEESGLIESIGDWVVHQACQQIARWQQAGLPVRPVAVNVSALQFRNGSITRSVAQALEQSAIAPELLEIEVTESVLAEDETRITQQLQALKAMGVSLAIDDFGTGYSSLSYLKRFPLDRLKIDRSFIQDLPTDQDDAAITRAIIDMARALGLSTLAEGVETMAQRDYLLRHGCDQVQGYLTGKPMPENDFAALLKGSRGEA